MPTVEKTEGGRVYVRSVGREFATGDQAEVSSSEAAYLAEERGDFALVDEPDAADVADDGDVREEDGPPDDAEGEAAPAVDPGDLTVPDLREALADIDDADELEAIREAEASDGDPRATALDAIDDRRDELQED